jgi:Putative zinc-finger
MADKHQNGRSGMSCADFDARVMDALDGVLSGGELEQFRAHVEECLECAPVYQQAKAGMEALKSLAVVEAPASLVHNILAKTTMTESSVAKIAQTRPSLVRRVADFISPNLAPAFSDIAGAFSLRNVMQPRFAMTAAMTFFSISLVLNATGFKFRDLKRMDLRPSAVATSASLQYHEATSKVIKYYENIRFVYEWEARLKSIKAASSEDEKKDQNKKSPDDNSSERRKRQQQRDVNYSLQQGASFLAVHFVNAPVSIPEAKERR